MPLVLAISTYRGMDHAAVKVPGLSSSLMASPDRSGLSLARYIDCANCYCARSLELSRWNENRDVRRGVKYFEPAAGLVFNSYDLYLMFTAARGAVCSSTVEPLRPFR
jgi:hypothetical protein